ncbi:FAD-dependent oxidoreductase [Paenibacillus sp. SYP-B3998]|uniref:NADH:ubiquinone reductase (non-electrogenic) n=1 Tax=Paenibacillus sp. SYP-B3998 TaxID=2678564 RepID=A0A6G4A0K1_9BACL|nr:FAD-dependent oxidoreductase [Paenibacillus sp. SYP-B3998]NEW07993.1 FAD-dependent oxidoreductase [Paenibacillus sp. SYP-B3998]
MEQHIVIVGGGYAGLNLVSSLQKQFTGQRGMRITLLDKETFHLRKVLLFQGAVEGTALKIPFSTYFDGTIEVIQGELSGVEQQQKRIGIKLPNGQTESLQYDRLILCLGSRVVSAAPEQGGHSLTDTDSSEMIRVQLERNVRDAQLAARVSERQRLLSVAVVGSGITGIETASVLACGLRRKAVAAGLDPTLISVTLIGSQARLLEAAPPHVSQRLEKELGELGVHILHGARAEAFRDGAVLLRDGASLPVGACVWTLGLRPNPLVQQLGLPLEGNGKLMVDERYHVKGCEHVYAIGDCAHVFDPLTGKADGMTCKEAIPQATRLAKIIKAELAGEKGPAHEAYMNLFCIGLGPEKGFIWIQKWGMNIVLTGKLGRQVRKLTWDMASLMSRKVVEHLQVEAGRK